MNNVGKPSKKTVWTDEAKVAFTKSKELLAQSALLITQKNCKLSIVADP